MKHKRRFWQQNWF